MAEPGARRTLRRRMALVAGALVLVLAALVLAVFWTPAVYRRTESIGPDPEAVAAFGTEVVNRIGNAMLDESGKTRLDLVLTERMVNARLAASLEAARAGGMALPEALDRLRVGFEPGAVVVATRLGEGAGSVVVAQRLEPTADAEGRLVVADTSLHAGALPLPAAVSDYLREVMRDHAARLRAEDPEDPVADLWAAAAEAAAGKPVPLGKGERRLHVDHIEVRHGELRVAGHRAPKRE